MKKIKVSLVFILLALLSLPMVSFSDVVDIYFNGTAIQFEDAQPQIMNGRTMAPFRAVFEAFKAEVLYDNDTGVATAKLGEIEVSFKENDEALTVIRSGEKIVYKMDVLPIRKNSRFFVPVRFISDAFGYHVSWDQAERAVTIFDLDGYYDTFKKDCSKIYEISEMYNSGKSYVIEEKMDIEFGKEKIYVEGSGKTDGVLREGAFNIKIDSDDKKEENLKIVMFEDEKSAYIKLQISEIADLLGTEQWMKIGEVPRGWDDGLMLLKNYTYSKMQARQLDEAIKSFISILSDKNVVTAKDEEGKVDISFKFDSSVSPDSLSEFSEIKKFEVEFKISGEKEKSLKTETKIYIKFANDYYENEIKINKTSKIDFKDVQIVRPEIKEESGIDLLLAGIMNKFIDDIIKQ